MIDKKTLSERDICTRFFTPALEAARWDKLTQILEEVSFTDGKIYVKLTRKERANNAKKRNYFARYGEQSRKVLDALPDKYADEGIENMERMEVLKVKSLTGFGSPTEIIKEFGSKQNYLNAVKELENELYKAV